MKKHKPSKLIENGYPNVNGGEKDAQVKKGFFLLVWHKTTLSFYCFVTILDIDICVIIIVTDIDVGMMMMMIYSEMKISNFFLIIIIN